MDVGDVWIGSLVAKALSGVGRLVRTQEYCRTATRQGPRQWRMRHGVLCSAMWRGTHISGSAAVYAHLVHARFRGDFLQIDAALIVAQQRVQMDRAIA